MTVLENKVKTLADAYYQGNEQISDAEYDALIDQLRKESPKSELLPENQGIAGSDLKGVDKKYKLDITMGTLAKCNTDEQFEEWWKKHDHNDIVVESKIDGAGCYLHYENGEFKYARSRGNGEYGTDLTDKLLEIVVKQRKDKADDWPNGRQTVVYEKFYASGNVSYPQVETGSIDIRGEVVLKRSVWKKYFSDTKNPRNCVSGLLGRKDAKKEDLEKLTFIAYDVFDSEGRYDVTEMGKLQFLQANKFDIPDNMHLFGTTNPKIAKKSDELNFQSVKAWKDCIDTSKAEIPCDGLVIKQNKVDKNDLARHTPLNNVAYKPNLQIAVTKVVDIEWSMSGRYLSPVAIVGPVELEGTTVQRASLANINKMEELGIEIGSTVEIKKSGMIIPQIVKVIA